MGRLNSNRKPTFFWQGLMILLPVMVLAVVGAYSLRQDKLLAEREAADRAQAIADDLVAKVWAELTVPKDTKQFSRYYFEVDRAGKLVFPPPYLAVPVARRFDLSKLGLKTSALWAEVQRAGSGTDPEDLDAAIHACTDFLALNPPAEFAAIATFNLGQLYLQSGDKKSAEMTFLEIAQGDSDTVTESGLELKPIAELKLLEINPNKRDSIRVDPASRNRIEYISLDSFCSNFVYQPSALTPYLLSKAAELEKAPGSKNADKWMHVWEEQEWSRQLFYAAKPQVPTNLGLASLNPNLSWDPTGRNIIESYSKPLNILPKASGTLPSPEKPRPFWFDAPFTTERSGTHWLAVPCEGDPITLRFACIEESEIGKRITRLVEGARSIPEYFGVGVEIAGSRVSAGAPDLRLWELENYVSRTSDGQKRKTTSQLASTVLASAQKFDSGAELLKINVYLTGPAALYKHHSARTIWFGSLIVVSAVAALIGFLAARRAFHRQLRLSEMKSNFVSSVSHELRAPIASVRLMAEGLERGKIQDQQKQHEYFRFITQECRRLSSLIENVLDFSRIEQGRKQYEMESTDLVALARQTVGLMQTYAAEQQIQISFETKGDPVPLDLDSKAIQQALINLIDNAIKHSPKGAKITVGLDLGSGSERIREENIEHRTSNAEHRMEREGFVPVQLWVEDHGEGIPPAEHEKIFERFYRLGSELRRHTQGVGIGLSIVKHIVEAHGGRIEVRSVVGEGSRFTILLPRE